MICFHKIPPPLPVMPPVQDGLGALSSKAWYTPARTTPIPGRAPRYPDVRNPWATSALVEWYADMVNTGLYRPGQYDPQQTAVLAAKARRRGLIHSEMARRHLWVEQRHRSPRIRYLPPYRHVTGGRNIPPATAWPEPAAERIIETEPRVLKQVGRFIYKQVGNTWSRIQHRRAHQMIPIPTRWRAGTQLLQRRYDPRELRRQVKQQKLQREADKSFRARAQQIRAGQLRTQ